MMKQNENLSPIQVKSAVDILIDRLTQAIIDGTFKAGERIPTEPELASVFGVGRNTVREAIRTLASYGVLEVRRPNGTFVCDEFKAQGINPMIYGLILQKDGAYNELIDLRKVVENGVLLLLTEKGLTMQQKETLCGILENFDRALEEEDCRKILEADIQFHSCLSEFTNNKLIVLVNDMIAKLTYASRLKTIEKIMQEGNGQYLMHTHHNLIEQLDSKDIGKLYQAIQDSYIYWKDIYKEDLQEI